MENSSKQISFLRSTLKLTQEAFGQSVGYSRSYVKDIESGRVKPSRAFLEAVNAKHGISIDSLLSSLGELIVNIINRIPQRSDYGFIYLYDFTDEGLNEAETELMKYLSNHSYSLIDGRDIKTERELYARLANQDKNIKIEKLWKKSWNLFINNMHNRNRFHFIVLKHFSSSPLNKREVAVIYRHIAYNINYIGALIVIDKPCFLEKYSNLLYYYAYPIHYKDWSGRIHSPVRLVKDEDGTIRWVDIKDSKAEKEPKNQKS